MPATIMQLLQKTAPRGKAPAAPKVEKLTGDALPFEAELKKVQEKEPKAKTESTAATKKTARKKDAPGAEPTDEMPEESVSAESKPAKPVDEADGEEVTDEVESPVTEEESPEQVSDQPDGVPTDLLQMPVAATVAMPVEAVAVETTTADATAQATDAIESTDAKPHSTPLNAFTTASAGQGAAEQPQGDAGEAPAEQTIDPNLIAGLEADASQGTTPAAASNKPVTSTTEQASDDTTDVADSDRQGVIKLDEFADAADASTELPESQVVAAIDDLPEHATSSGQSDSAKLTSTIAQTATPTPTHTQGPAHASQPQAPAPQPEVHFAEANHPKIVTGMKAQLLPQGGSMQIRLDPPEMGALLVSVQMRDGILTASFQTSNDDATKLLSHSLTQLKAALETQGVHVEKLQVEQAPRQHQAQNDDPQQQRQGGQDANSAWEEQQRKQMLQRMWKRIAMGADPLDLVA